MNPERRSRNRRSAAVSAEDQPQRPRILAGTRWNPSRPLRPTCCGWCSAHTAALREKSSRRARILQSCSTEESDGLRALPFVPIQRPSIGRLISGLLCVHRVSVVSSGASRQHGSGSDIRPLPRRAADRRALPKGDECCVPSPPLPPYRRRPRLRVAGRPRPSNRSGRISVICTPSPIPAVPQGHSKIAQHLRAGSAMGGRAKSRRDGRPSLPLTRSSLRDLRVESTRRVPSTQVLGYSQSSLRDDQNRAAARRPDQLGAGRPANSQARTPAVPLPGGDGRIKRSAGASASSRRRLRAAAATGGGGTGNTRQGCPVNWQARMPAPPARRGRQLVTAIGRLAVFSPKKPRPSWSICHCRL